MVEISNKILKENIKSLINGKTIVVILNTKYSTTKSQKWYKENSVLGHPFSHLVRAFKDSFPLQKEEIKAH